MKDLTSDDLKLASIIIDDIIDNTSKDQIESKIKDYTKDYINNRKRQFLVLLNSLFGGIILNELHWRCNEAEERALEARRVTKLLNGR